MLRGGPATLWPEALQKRGHWDCSPALSWDPRAAPPVLEGVPGAGLLREGAERPLGSGARLQALLLAGSRPASVAAERSPSCTVLVFGGSFSPSPTQPQARPSPLGPPLVPSHFLDVSARTHATPQCDRLASGLLGVPVLPFLGVAFGPPCPPSSPVTLGVGPGHSRHPSQAPEDRDMLRGQVEDAVHTEESVQSAQTGTAQGLSQGREQQSAPPWRPGPCPALGQVNLHGSFWFLVWYPKPCVVELWKTQG